MLEWPLSTLSHEVSTRLAAGAVAAIGAAAMQPNLIATAGLAAAEARRLTSEICVLYAESMMVPTLVGAPGSVKNHW